MFVNRLTAALAAAALAAACGGESPHQRAAAERAAPTTKAATPAPVDTASQEHPAPPPALADTDTRPPAGPPPPIRHVATPNPVRGLYVSRAAARGDAVWKLIALARHSPVNALVFDVKDDQGLLLYPSTVGLAHLVGADTVRPMPVRRLHALMDSLRKYHIYPIARIAVARDPVLAAHRPQWAVLRRADDSERNAWLDPRHREVWAYAADLASEAVARGFSEVQFADARFPDSRNQAQLLELTSTDGRTRSQVIRDQLGFLDSRVSVLPVPMAIAVDGMAAVDSSDLNTGQRWEMLADRADVVMPTIFPSRFPAGTFGIASPAAQPSETVRQVLAAALRRSGALRDAAGVVPWYQDFPAGTAVYGAAQVRAQIDAGEAAGVRSWMLWNPESRYTEAALGDSARAIPAKPPKPAPARKVSGRAGGRSRR